MPGKKNSISTNNGIGTTRQRFLQGQVVIPTLYDGTAVGKGRFMTGMVNGQLVLDPSTDKPVPLKQIGSLS